MDSASSATHVCVMTVFKLSCQADDRKFKEELGRVIEMDVWDSAKAVAAERLKAAKIESSKLEHEVVVRQNWLAELREQVWSEV